MNQIAFVLAARLVAGTLLAQPAQPEAADVEEKAVAIVLGEKVTATEEREFTGRVFGPLLQQFAKENKIEPTDKELDDFIRGTKRADARDQARLKRDQERLQQELKAAGLDERDRQAKQSQLTSIERRLKGYREDAELDREFSEEEHRALDREIAAHFVKSWKINKALYEKYGGRVIWQQAGLEPVDAYRDLLKEHEKKGSFRILDKQHEPAFWRYFTDDSMHTFIPPDKAAKAINTPWWLSDEEETDDRTPRRP